MRIAVNTRLLQKDKLEGIGWFTFESLQRITRSHPEHEFLFLFDRPFNEEFIFSENIRPIVVGPPTRHPVLWYWWFEQSLPRIFRKYSPDLFLSPDGFLSLSSTIPQLPVIHDLNFEYYPKDFPFLAIRYFKNYFPQYARKARRIATVSEYSKQDISKCYSISPDKIDVVYDGVHSIFKPLHETDKTSTKNRYTQGSEYLLFVGALSPRKNVVRLLQAYDEFKSRSNHPVKLVIAGERMWKTAEIDQTLQNMKYASDVLFTGRVQPEDLRLIMASALALIFVPYFEGFGIPIVEAMSCDVPVVTSNVTSMPEVAGDAGLLVDPFSVESIRDGIHAIVHEKELRDKLVGLGRIQREKFSWDKTAEALWNCIERTTSHA